MRLIAERSPGQMTIPLSKCSPSGTPRRGERAKSIRRIDHHERPSGARMEVPRLPSGTESDETLIE